MTLYDYDNLILHNSSGRKAHLRWDRRRGYWVLRRGLLVTRHDSRDNALRLARKYVREGGA